MTKERELLARVALVIAQYRWSNPAKYAALHMLSQQITEALEDHPQEEPAKPPFIRLTDEEIERLMDNSLFTNEIDERQLVDFARDIEDALVEKNK